MSLEVYGDEGDIGPEGYVTDEVYDEMCAEKDAEIARLRESLAPSAATKAAYMGEFQFGLPDIDEQGNEVMRSVNVPWTTIKKIMAAILERASGSVIAPSPEADQK